MIDKYEEKLKEKTIRIHMMYKVSGDQKIRIEYLEKEIKNHNQKHKDF